MWEKDPFPIINFNNSPTDYARQIAALSCTSLITLMHEAPRHHLPESLNFIQFCVDLGAQVNL